MTDGTRICTKHKGQEEKHGFDAGGWRPWEKRKTEKLGLYHTDRWQRIRKLKLHRNPVCEVCKCKPATAVHHIKQARLHPELQFDMENLQSICQSCHAKESQREAVEARCKGIGESSDQQ